MLQNCTDSQKFLDLQRRLEGMANAQRVAMQEANVRQAKDGQRLNDIEGETHVFANPSRQRMPL